MAHPSEKDPPKEKAHTHLTPKDTAEAIELTDRQQTVLSLRWKDEQDHYTDAPPNAVPVWETKNKDIVDLEPATDGLTCVAVALEKVGEAVVIARTVDAEGNDTTIGSRKIKVVCATPKTIEITAAAPTAKP